MTHDDEGEWRYRVLRETRLLREGDSTLRPGEYVGYPTPGWPRDPRSVLLYRSGRDGPMVEVSGNDVERLGPADK
jgi:hypothetical protein